MFQAFIEKIEHLIYKLYCKVGYHDYQKVIPEHFHIYYEQVPCTCGYVFKALSDIKEHLRFGAPSCQFNRVCMRCHHVDMRLERELQKIINENNKPQEIDQYTKAKQILEEYVRNRNKS